MEANRQDSKRLKSQDDNVNIAMFDAPFTQEMELNTFSKNQGQTNSIEAGHQAQAVQEPTPAAQIQQNEIEVGNSIRTVNSSKSSVIENKDQNEHKGKSLESSDQKR